jgi:hypothetical protein
MLTQSFPYNFIFHYRMMMMNSFFCFKLFQEHFFQYFFLRFYAALKRKKEIVYKLFFMITEMYNQENGFETIKVERTK